MSDICYLTICLKYATNFQVSIRNDVSDFLLRVDIVLERERKQPQYIFQPCVVL